MIQDPLYLLLDEPSLGLAPIIVTQIYNNPRTIYGLFEGDCPGGRAV
jgi:ABC-type branched-subunit amino acid transport system ATPase component